jgi:hypothetical protein
LGGFSSSNRRWVERRLSRNGGHRDRAPRDWSTLTTASCLFAAASHSAVLPNPFFESTAAPLSSSSLTTVWSRDHDLGTWRTHGASSVSKVLVSAKFWCQKSSGTSKVLVPEKLWCQQSSDVSKILVPEKFWCQKRLWCQQNSGARKALVSAKFK